MRLNLERLDVLIAQYVSGSLPEPAHVLIGSHLEMRKSAVRFARTLEHLAGKALNDNEPLSLSSRDAQLRGIFNSPAPVDASVESVRSRLPEEGLLPKSLRGYAGRDLTDIPWKTKLPGVRQHVIEKSNDVETSLLWTRPGRALPHHGHHGLELTLVLGGRFHDHRGSFGQGDVSVADETLDHRPIASSAAPCICFSVLFAPIALSGSTVRLLGDILGF